MSEPGEKNEDRSGDRIYKITYELSQKIDYLIIEYDLNCAELVGILYILAHKLLEENKEEEDER